MTSDLGTYEALRLLIALRGIAPPASAPADGLRLSSQDLGSKFGFGDGDTPDTVFDLVEAYYGDYRYVERSIWHAVLIDLVHTRLLPALDAAVPGLYTFDSLHSPIRLEAPLPSDFPHRVVYVPWLDVLARVIAGIESPTNT